MLKPALGPKSANGRYAIQIKLNTTIFLEALRVTSQQYMRRRYEYSTHSHGGAK
jgi:hypothetical protein